MPSSAYLPGAASFDRLIAPLGGHKPRRLLLDLSYLRAIRRGEVELADVVTAIDRAEARLIELSNATSVPDQPDRDWVDRRLHRSHLAFWDLRAAASR